MQSEVVPKVSVCVVTYNQEKYIRQCLQSIVDQETDFLFEVIVGDDCSTDGTPIIIREFADRYPQIVKPLFHKQNIGVFQNYRFVHDQAKGDYVCHMDGDDFWLPGKIAYQTQLLDENPKISQCWTCAELVDDNGKKIGIFPSHLAKIFNPKKITTRDIALSYALVGHHSTQMYRREARRSEMLGEQFLDYWVAFTNSLSGDGFYSKKILSAYRMGNIDSITRNKNRKRATVDLLSGHLLEIIESYPLLSEYAKANMVGRYAVSKIRGHDLTTISQKLTLAKDVPLKMVLMAKTLFYFALQKM